MTRIKRVTKETNIELELNINGSGESKIDTKIGFFDHMLESFAKHSSIDISLKCEGDIYVDFHHSVEDVGIVIGEALKKEIFPVENIERFADFSVVMDEACVSSTIDISNRPYLYFELPIDGKVGDFDVELCEEFFKALITHAKITAHIVYQRGKNRHHIIEAAFKAFAISLKKALKKGDKVGIPSTKGVI